MCAKYLTPNVVRAMGTGIPLTPVSDADLAGLIAAAEIDIDTWMGFPEADPGFATGQRTENHPWDKTFKTRRVYPRCSPVPVQSLQTFNIVLSQNNDGGQTQAVIPPNLVVINSDEGYMEPVSLNVIVGSLTPALLQFALHEPFAHVVFTAGYAIQKTSCPLWNSDGIHQMYHSLLPSWDTVAQAPQVFVNGVVQPSGYTVNAQDGAVLFTTPLAQGSFVTATFIHQIPDGVVQATRAAFIDRAGEYFANTFGMTAFDRLTLGSRTMQRRGSSHSMFGGRAQEPAWARLLPEKHIRVALA